MKSMMIPPPTTVAQTAETYSSYTDTMVPLPVADNQADSISNSFTEDDASALCMVSSSGARSNKFLARLILIFMITIGVGASVLFLEMGITNARTDEFQRFDRSATDLIQEIETAFHDYEVAGLWIQEASRQRSISRQDFRALYLNLISTGLEFQVASFNPNVTSPEEREALEDEASHFYAQEYPDIDYQGIKGLEPNEEDGLSVLHRSEQPFYFPVHLLEPVDGNERAIDFDLYSSASRRQTIDRALDAWKPNLTPRIQLVQETDASAFSVILMHPGIPLPNLTRPDSFSSMVIRIPALLQRAIVGGQVEKSISVYIYDIFDHVDASQQFLGAAMIPANRNEDTMLEALPQADLATLRARHSKSKAFVKEMAIEIVSDQSWLIVVEALEGTYDTNLTFVILAGVLLLVLCISLGVFIYCNFHRINKMNQIKSQAQKARTFVVVRTARKAARAERDLNDFIAHEVRNPLSAAMSACSFVSSVVESQPLIIEAEEERQSVKEDIHIIESSLHFINDLLRTMLDVHRANSNQLKIEEKPTHLMNDVIRSVDSMLHRRGSSISVELECSPSNLMVSTDSLRLKQIILNLARNSIKFVTDGGFIRIRAVLVNNSVQLSVSDSGPGIPPKKREHIFRRFQDSLDYVNQGTGIGLSLSKTLTDLMGGKLYIDDGYDSGVPGCPGTRFVVELNKPPLQIDDIMLDKYEASIISPTTGATGQTTNDIESGAERSQEDPNTFLNKPQHQTQDMTKYDITNPLAELPDTRRDLPDTLNVLFVDDDMILRKLFSRSLKRVAPGWTIHEAANGETALLMVESQQFDVIFMDQYMASVQKQLLGTEATRALRAKGVTAKICGLSANDVAESFREAGAESFLFKPFPCKAEALKKELVRIIHTEGPRLSDDPKENSV
jgi:signal transduction histidine kinase/CheY-like chemotaxis protein